MEIDHRPDGSVLVSEGRARVLMTVPTPGVVMLASEGGGETRVDCAVMDLLGDEIDKAGRVELFVDMRDAKGMALETRKHAMPWAKKYKSKISCAHILVGSKLAEIALRILAVFAGGRLEIYGTTNALLAQVRRHAPEVDALPSVPTRG
jgi:hypothetical protein